MTIKILRKRAVRMPSLSVNGDWIDLFAPEYVNCVYERGKSGIIDLGIAMQLPKGYEAIVAPRSSTFKHFGIILANSIGIIDNSYCGNTDYWKFPAIALRHTTIHYGDKIAQFRIQLSQKATIWQKIKWLFSNNITLKFYDVFYYADRVGFG